MSVMVMTTLIAAAVPAAITVLYALVRAVVVLAAVFTTSPARRTAALHILQMPRAFRPPAAPADLATLTGLTETTDGQAADPGTGSALGSGDTSGPL